MELDHSFVWVDNLVMLEHSSVGVDNAAMLDHSSAGVVNAAMLNQFGYLVVVVEECVMLGHSSVEVENFVEVHSFYHPLAWNPGCCKRDSLGCLAIDYSADSLVFLLDFSQIVLVEVEG